MKTEGDDWFAFWRFAALLAVLFLVCFPQVVLGLGTFYLVDFGHFGYPLAFHNRESFFHGNVPLWNPWNNCGIPFLAEWNTLTLYPFSLVYMILPLPWSLNIFCLGHLYLAGLGMFCLARRWTGSGLAGAFAGTVFSFNGLTWYGLMWPSNTAGWGWMPWVVLAVERAWNKGGINLVYASLAAALQLLAGAPEVTLQTWLVIGVFWGVEWIGASAARLRMTVRALGVGGLAAGLVAGQLLPFFQLLSESSRSAHFGDSSMAGMAAMPWFGWANYLVPLFHCQRGPQGVFFQANQSWTSSYYLGSSIVALALLAVGKARQRRVWILALLAALSLVLALGNRGWAYEGVRRLIPPIEFMRYPVKFVMLATFVLPLLAAYGLNWLQRTSIDNWFRARNQVLSLGLGILGLMGLIVIIAWKHPLADGEFDTTLENALGRAVFLIMILGGAVWLRQLRDRILRRVLQTALIVLVWSDVFTHAPNLSPTVPNAAFEPDLIRRFFRWDHQLQAGTSRAMLSKAAFWRMLSTGSPDPVLDTHGRRLSLFMDFNLLDHAAKFDGLYPLDLKDFLDIFKQLYFTTNEAEALKDFLGIALTSHPTNLIDWIPRTSAQPLITAGQHPVFAERAEILREIVSGRFDSKRVVYLPEESRGVIQATGQAKARIVDARYSPHRWEIDVETDAPALVVLAQTSYPCWKASVNGQPSRLWRANHAFQALEIPRGRHQVSVFYQDHRFVAGIVVSVFLLILCGGILYYQWSCGPDRFIWSKKR